MPVSKRFLNLLRFQLEQFRDCADLDSLIVYVAQPGANRHPDLIPVGRWPQNSQALPTLASDSPLREPAERRRWLPLRHENVLLGALQVDAAVMPWPAPLSHRLQAVALCLTEALCLDLEHQQLRNELQQQQEQTRLLLHQLRNPLAALRTFGQLLRRRLGPGSPHQDLVEGLLAEERQLNRYVDALDQLGGPALLTEATTSPSPLLLPPIATGTAVDLDLATTLAPLLKRAAATAALQGRPWHGPTALPPWRGDCGSVAEVIANLLENAFRYSPLKAAVGLHCRRCDHGWQLSVWDEGEPIPSAEREAIFEQGVRGSSGRVMPGTGVGLALGRDLARGLGGELELVSPPVAVDAALPARGNAFVLSLPPGPGATPGP